MKTPISQGKQGGVMILTTDFADWLRWGYFIIVKAIEG